MPGRDFEPTGLTTPDPLSWQAGLRRWADAGLQAAVVEASSIGLQEGRLEATRIRTAVFSNLTQDHLDYHGSMEAYWRAKTRLFAWPGLRAAVINIDDAHGAVLAAELAQRDAAAQLDLWTLSMLPGRANRARLQAQDIDYGDGGLRFSVVEGAARCPLSTQLIGSYNVSNLLGVIATMRSIGVPLAAAVQACAQLTPVPGRMQCVGVPGRPLVAIDYAHTPDALAKALDALKPMAQRRGGQHWCVFGSGGDRDARKRPIMGALAAKHADRIVVTSDNPRSEAADAIIGQILLGLTGVSGVVVEPDRAQAITHALAQAAPADVVLVAGKGHEDYQEIAGRRLPFSDLAVVSSAFGLSPDGAPA